MKNIFLFILLGLLISCDDDTSELFTDVSSDNSFANSKVEEANQQFLKQNPFLTQESDGLFYFKSKSNQLKRRFYSEISAVITANSECEARNDEGVITYEGLDYDLYVTVQLATSYAREVMISVTKNSNIIHVRSLTIPSGAYHSNFIPFSWINETDLGLIEIDVIEVIDLIPSNNSVFQNGIERVNSTANYTAIQISPTVLSCKPTYNLNIDPNDLEDPWFPGAGAGQPASLDPCDCDGDQILNDEDEDDNNNGLDDVFEGNFDGCDGSEYGC